MAKRVSPAALVAFCRRHAIRIVNDDGVWCIEGVFEAWTVAEALAMAQMIARHGIAHAFASLDVR